MYIFWDFPGASVDKESPAFQETQADSGSVPRLGRKEDPLEKEMAVHSSILAWRIPWTEDPGKLQCIGVSQSWT